MCQFSLKLSRLVENIYRKNTLANSRAKTDSEKHLVKAAVKGARSVINKCFFLSNGKVLLDQFFFLPVRFSASGQCDIYSYVPWKAVS